MYAPLPFPRGAEQRQGLERPEWARCLEGVERERAGGATTVALLPPRSAGARRDPGLPLRAIGYDPGSDVLEIAVGGGPARHPALRYFLAGPRRILLAEDGGELTIVVEDNGGARTLVRIGSAATSVAGEVAGSPAA
jgi:hypothetical protein